LPAQHLDRVAPHLDRRSRPIERGTAKVGVQERNVADRHGLHDLAAELRLRGDQTGQHRADRIAAGERLARSQDEPGTGLVERDDRVEIAGVDVLLEHTGPVLGLHG
jgi:hypothetical protein